MKREFFKGLTMLTAIIVIALASAVVSANAQSLRYVRTDIPFEFTVGDKTLPAGDYQVTSAFGSTLAIQSRDSSVSAMRISNTIQPERNKQHPRLVFHRYGRQYFLAEVWSGVDATGRQLVKSKKERAIEREFATIAAKTGTPVETYAIVELAAMPR